jgi:hypothetical protein
MTRVRSPHDFHEVKIHNPESICKKCSTQTSKICEWCGVCHNCHEGIERNEEY